MYDPYAKKMERLEQAVLSSHGELEPAVRRVAATSGEVPEVMRKYVDKVSRYAYRVTDEDVARLCAVGYSEDQIFELTVSVALGAGLSRLHAGLAALSKGENDATPEH